MYLKDLLVFGREPANLEPRSRAGPAGPRGPHRLERRFLLFGEPWPHCLPVNVAKWAPRVCTRTESTKFSSGHVTNGSVVLDNATSELAGNVIAALCGHRCADVALCEDPRALIVVVRICSSSRSEREWRGDHVAKPRRHLVERYPGA